MKPIVSSILAVCIALISGCTFLLATTSGPEGVDQYHGKRTFGAKIEDQAIEAKTRVNLQKQLPEYGKSRFKVVSFNGIVLLLGQVPGQETLAKAEMITKRIRHVRRVHNKLEQSPKHSIIRRFADSWMTYKIKMQFLGAAELPASRVKVITMGGVVYLMGLLTEAEADKATDIARRAGGVKRVVKVFEFIDPEFA